MLSGKLPFLSDSGNNIFIHGGYFFVDGKVTMVSDIYPEMADWLKVKAYITVLSEKESTYVGLPKKGQDEETKQFIKILNDKKFKKWVEDNPDHNQNGETKMTDITAYEELLAEIESVTSELQLELVTYSSGGYKNKSCAARIRKVTLSLAELGKEFRKASVAFHK